MWGMLSSLSPPSGRPEMTDWKVGPTVSIVGRVPPDKRIAAPDETSVGLNPTYSYSLCGHTYLRRLIR